MSLRCCAYRGTKLAENVTCGQVCPDFPACLPSRSPELRDNIRAFMQGHPGSVAPWDEHGPDLATDAQAVAAMLEHVTSRWLSNVTRLLGLDLIADLTRSGDGEVGLVARGGELFVLKTQDGGLDEPIRLLRAYARLGVACPRVIDVGTEPLPWVLLSYEQGRPTTVVDARQRLPHATRLVRRLHEVSPHDNLDWFRSYSADVASIYTHDRARGSVPAGPDPQEITRRLSFDGRLVQLHGDWHPVNTLLRGDTFVVLDPIGFVGPAEYDVAAWCVRGCGEPDGLLARLDAAGDAYPELDREQLVLWAALDCLGRARSARGASPARWARAACRLLHAAAGGVSRHGGSRQNAKAHEAREQ
jgi:Phosphotransferase enzyme family